jgi:electron transfer flavoprotein alpha subunit
MNSPKVVIVLEHKDDQLNPASRVLASKGRALADSLGGDLIALVCGNDLGGVIDELQEQPVDLIAVVRDPSLVYPEATQVVNAILGVYRDVPFQMVLLGHSHLGIGVGCLLSTIWSSTFTANCLEVTAGTDGDLFCIRPIFGGTVKAKFKIAGPGPSVLTLQPQRSEKPAGECSRRPTVKAYPLQKIELDANRSVTTLECFEPTSENSDLSKAKIVIGVGRGIGAAEHLPAVFDLARSLGAFVACSRPLVDVGWLSAQHLVGVSGATVSPKVYVALGISGAAQHLAGMMNSELIIAVNKDPLAPIFDYAHYGLVADVHEVLPVLKDELENMVQTQ